MYNVHISYGFGQGWEDYPFDTMDEAVAFATTTMDEWSDSGFSYSERTKTWDKWGDDVPRFYGMSILLDGSDTGWRYTEEEL